MEYCQKAFMGRENTQIVNITIRQQGLVIKSYSKKELINIYKKYKRHKANSIISVGPKGLTLEPISLCGTD